MQALDVSHYFLKSLLMVLSINKAFAFSLIVTTAITKYFITVSANRTFPDTLAIGRG